MDRRAVVELLVDRARLARAGEAAEAGAAGAHAPGRHGDRERPHLGRDRLGVEPAPGEPGTQVRVVGREVGREAAVVVGDEGGVDAERGHGAAPQRLKAIWLPASTLSTLPV